MSCPLSVKFRLYGPYPVTSETIDDAHWQLRNYGETLNRSENLLLVCVVYKIYSPRSDNYGVDLYMFFNYQL